jgi:hypothetical protein
MFSQVVIGSVVCSVDSLSRYGRVLWSRRAASSFCSRKIAALGCAGASIKSALKNGERMNKQSFLLQNSSWHKRLAWVAV